MRRTNRRNLFRARQLEAHRAGWPRTRRATFADDPRGKFSGLSGRNPGPGIDREYAEASRKIRRGIQVRNRDGSGLDETAVQSHVWKRDGRDKDVDRCGGSFRAPAWTERRARIDRPRAFDLRDV